MSTEFVVIFTLGFLAFLGLVVFLSMRPDKAAHWPVTEGTIQLVNTVFVQAGRGSHSVDVADFSYKVNNEYCSGRLAVSQSPSNANGDCSLRVLINQKIQVRYDPQRPENFSVAQAEVAGFLLYPYNEPWGTDVAPIDLNLDKL